MSKTVEFASRVVFKRQAQPLILKKADPCFEKSLCSIQVEEFDGQGHVQD